jgi:hypothetical protein
MRNCDGNKMPTAVAAFAYSKDWLVTDSHRLSSSRRGPAHLQGQVIHRNDANLKEMIAPSVNPDPMAREYP